MRYHLLRDAFGPMPTVKTVIARLRLFAIIIGGWLILAALVVLHSRLTR